VESLTGLGKVNSALYGNGVVNANFYDTAGSLTTVLSGKRNYNYGNVQRLDYRYDALGNVVQRTDTFSSGKYIEDRYTYDGMNRITRQRSKTNIVSRYPQSVSYTYDAIGNIVYKSDVGGSYYYGAKPHAVARVGSRTYRYDEVGNMVYRNGDTMEYMPNNKLYKVKGKSVGEAYYYYGIGGKRFMKRSSTGKTTYYIGQHYQEEVEDNKEKQLCFLTIGGKTIGVHTEVKNTYYAPNHPKYNEKDYNRYFHFDALGSITTITDNLGKVVERRSYDAFGRIRSMDYGTIEKGLTTTTLLESVRGYTGHEHIPEVAGLIHMNARVYDVGLGRFLSADTIIQDPHDTQAYNRYSYVRNNPLNATDPTGHSWLSKLWDKVSSVVIGVVTAVLAIYTGGVALMALTGQATLVAASTVAASGGLVGFGSLMVSGAIGGFMGGVAGGLLSGANLSDSLSMGLKGAGWGAVSAGVAFGIGEVATTFRASWGGAIGKAALHGLSRAAIAKAQYGTGKGAFGAGFISSLFHPQALGVQSSVGKVAASAIVGGTASVIGGGKFANGAVSGAFIWMFNRAMHPDAPAIMKNSRYYDEKNMEVLKEYYSEKAKLRRGVQAGKDVKVFVLTTSGVMIGGGVGGIATRGLYRYAMMNPDKVLLGMEGIGIADNLFLGGTPFSSWKEMFATILHDFNPWAVK
jgi:RHS repeat-associated protein